MLIQGTRSSKASVQLPIWNKSTKQQTDGTTHTNNTVAKGFNQMASHAQTITVAFDMSKAFDTMNIHTLIIKLLQTNIPGIIIKFIANYIKGRKVYTTYRNHTSRQRYFKLSFHKAASVHPHYLTFTRQTYTTQCAGSGHAYADDITTHPHTQPRVQPRNIYNHTYRKCLPGQNKTTS